VDVSIVSSRAQGLLRVLSKKEEGVAPPGLVVGRSIPLQLQQIGLHSAQEVDIDVIHPNQIPARNKNTTVSGWSF